MANTAKNTGTPNEKINKAMNLVNEARVEKMDQTRKQISETIEDTKEKLNTYSENASEMIKDSVKNTEQKIQTKPFQFLAGAAIIGLIFGFLFGRKK